MADPAVKRRARKSSKGKGRRRPRTAPTSSGAGPDAEDGVNIKVVVRCRPSNKDEKGTPNVVGVDNDNNRICVRQSNAARKGGVTEKAYAYDGVFGPESTQQQVYDTVVTPIVAEVLSGYNCSILAYGQTGTGKTFTMTGERDPSSGLFAGSEQAGIIPRTIENIFQTLNAQSAEYTVRVSYLELYNEELIDLLAVDETLPLRIYEDVHNRAKGICVQNLEEVLVSDSSDIYKILDIGGEKRRTFATKMNAASSRSHTIFTLTLHLKESTPDGEDLLKVGKLHLVDLAGSENIGRSGAQGSRKREAGNINASLLTLGRVINALVEHQPHIPYRESKLTRLLQDSLGGRTKTCIVATVSPSSLNAEESVSTLDYAFRAKNIRNRPEVNQKMTKRALLKSYTEEIETLQDQLRAAREKDGVFLTLDRYEEMTVNAEAQRETIEELEGRIEAATKEFEELKELLEATNTDLAATRSAHAATTATLAVTAESLAMTQEELTGRVATIREQGAVVSELRETEAALHGQAVAVSEVLAESVVDVGGLHAKVGRMASTHDGNAVAVAGLRSTVDEFLSEASGLASTFKEHQAMRFDAMASSMAAFHEANAEAMTELGEEAGSLRESVAALQAAISGAVVDANGASDEAAATLEFGVAGGNTAVRETLAGLVATIEAHAAAVEARAAFQEESAARWAAEMDSLMAAQDEAVGAFAAHHAEAMSNVAAAVAAFGAEEQSALDNVASRVAETEERSAASLASMEASLMTSFQAMMADAIAAHQAQVSASLGAIQSEAEERSVRVGDFAAEVATECGLAPSAAGAFVSEMNHLASGVAATAGDVVAAVTEEAATIGDEQGAVLAAISAAGASIESGLVTGEMSVAKAVAAFCDNQAGFAAAVNAAVEVQAVGVSGAVSGLESTGERLTAGAAGIVDAICGETDAATGEMAHYMEAICGAHEGANEAVVSFGLADVPITGATPAKRAYPADTAFVRARPDESIVRDFYGEPASPVAPSQRSTGEAASDHVAASQTETETEIEAEANSDDAENDSGSDSMRRSKRGKGLIRPKVYGSGNESPAVSEADKENLVN